MKRIFLKFLSSLLGCHCFCTTFFEDFGVFDLVFILPALVSSSIRSSSSSREFSESSSSSSDESSELLCFEDSFSFSFELIKHYYNYIKKRTHSLSKTISKSGLLQLLNSLLIWDLENDSCEFFWFLVSMIFSKEGVLFS